MQAGPGPQGSPRQGLLKDEQRWQSHPHGSVSSHLALGPPLTPPNAACALRWWGEGGWPEGRGFSHAHHSPHINRTPHINATELPVAHPTARAPRRTTGRQRHQHRAHQVPGGGWASWSWGPDPHRACVGDQGRARSRGKVGWKQVRGCLLHKREVRWGRGRLLWRQAGCWGSGGADRPQWSLGSAELMDQNSWMVGIKQTHKIPNQNHAGSKVTQTNSK